MKVLTSAFHYYESFPLLRLLECLPCHGNSLLKTRPFKIFHNGFEYYRDVDVLRTFFTALPACEE